ncbi:uncharacterized protein (DUF924 family) [Loktanella ponticola]|uniref:Uncharacterized protein (DUF924 family) n=1 Tax=Yoonia ponticola TaxID=1524255 RepID=A0A7W9BJJ9_9RHOB|nr:DUF924 family protein [Yoonia ponticola]MBB5721737.1 uncharacterized protein (DUF924 family) [Yoonia ponticola]
MSKIANPSEVTDYWLHTLAPRDWYVVNPDLDAEIRRRFQPTWDEARDGRCQDWLDTPNGLLAYLILCDQFPRNMFRGTGASFATDAMSRAATQYALDKEWDMLIPEPERQFVYMPLMHSEVLADHDLSIKLFATRMPETGENNREHGIAHRNIIAEFGRFPYRNTALGRETTPAEQRFLNAGGYGYELRKVQGAAA